MPSSPAPIWYCASGSTLTEIYQGQAGLCQDLWSLWDVGRNYQERLAFEFSGPTAGGIHSRGWADARCSRAARRGDRRSWSPPRAGRRGRAGRTSPSSALERIPTQRTVHGQTTAYGGACGGARCTMSAAAIHCEVISTGKMGVDKEALMQPGIGPAIIDTSRSTHHGPEDTRSMGRGSKRRPSPFVTRMPRSASTRTVRQAAKPGEPRINLDRVLSCHRKTVTGLATTAHGVDSRQR